MKGWKHIINDMVYHNEITDVGKLNFPDLEAYNLDAQDWFTFSGFFPPGYHQILIYDPKFQRAYCKDFIVK